MSKQTIVAVALLVLMLGVAGAVYSSYQKDAGNKQEIKSFADCVAAGNPVMESYPRQCNADGVTYTEPVQAEPNTDTHTYLSPTNHALRDVEFVNAVNAHPVMSIESPLTITGEAKGWYFEASFPIKVVDNAGKVLGTGIAQAQGDWMTSDYVPFEAKITFTVSEVTMGKIVFEKDNPSGLPENDEKIELLVSIQP